MSEPLVVLHPAQPVEIVSLVDHPRNYRDHPDDQLDHIEASLREHGQYRNVVLARDGTILAGHGVVKTAKRIGMETVQAIRLDIDPNDPRAISILVGDNESGKLADVDDRQLTELLRELAELDRLDGTGYDEAMLSTLVLVTRLEDEIPDSDHAAEWARAGMPEFEEFASPLRVVVSLDTASDRDRLLEMLGVEVINRKDRETWSVRWPPRPKEDISSVRFEPGPEQP